ncbi:hypothetical protein [Avibacterium paragallinarum]|uniref:hypothetical protein n=1 Tax=Avibacterium paragallinarum TaxID=728 RepID=UPI00397B23D9
MKNNNEPKLRYPEFTDAWEKCKLGEVFVQTAKFVNPDEQGLELWSLTIENGLTPKTERYNREFLVKKDDKYKLVSNNEFIYNPMNLTLGAIDLNRTGKKVCVSGYYITMTAHQDKYDNSYLLAWLRSYYAIQLYKNNATGSLKEKQRVQFPTFSKISTYSPSILEQQKIGALFRRLDRLITLHKRKWDDVILLKKALLQKMFPKNGERLPEIRFPEFSGDWEKCKLGEVASKVIEKNKNNEFQETLTNSAEFGVIPQRDFFDKDISNPENLSGYYIVKPDDFVYNPRISNLAPVGPIKRNLLNKIGIMSPLYFIFRVSNKVDYLFLDAFFATTNWHYFLKLNGDSGARADRIAIKDNVFMQMPIYAPTLPEQQKIGTFFRRLDRLISHHQQQYEHYQLLKKALLQQMFI